MNDKKLIKVVKNFITDDEIEVLNKWTSDNYTQPYFMDPKMNKDSIQTRFTTRHAYGREEKYKNFRVTYPKEVYNIQKRLLKYLNLNQTTIAPWPSFTDGVVTTITFPPGSCCKHIDPIYFPNTYTLHCNFVTQNPEFGGITYIEDTPFNFNKNDMLMYVTSHLQHEVTEISGKIPRILWVYGFCVDFIQMNQIFNLSKFNYQ